MTNEERLLNICFGLSLIYWGVAGLYQHFDALNTPIIRFFVTLLNISIGLLVIFRKPLIGKGSYRSILLSLPSFLCGGILFKLSTSLYQWETYAEMIFIFGGIFTLVSFLFLGRSFSIFPGMRPIVSGGMFRVVRHPAYLGEFFMCIGCLLAAEGYLSYIIFLVFIPSLIIRIKEEEQILGVSTDYQDYKKAVKWRLIPFVW